MLIVNRVNIRVRFDKSINVHRREGPIRLMDRKFYFHFRFRYNTFATWISNTNYIGILSIDVRLSLLIVVGRVRIFCSRALRFRFREKEFFFYDKDLNDNYHVQLRGIPINASIQRRGNVRLYIFSRCFKGVMATVSRGERWISNNDGFSNLCGNVVNGFADTF